jgi:hypothetical protein
MNIQKYCEQNDDKKRFIAKINKKNNKSQSNRRNRKVQILNTLNQCFFLHYNREFNIKINLFKIKPF